VLTKRFLRAELGFDWARTPSALHEKAYRRSCTKQHQFSFILLWSFFLCFLRGVTSGLRRPFPLACRGQSGYLLSQWMLHWWRVSASPSRELFPCTHLARSWTGRKYPFSSLWCHPTGNRTQLTSLNGACSSNCTT